MASQAFAWHNPTELLCLSTRKKTRKIYLIIDYLAQPDRYLICLSTNCIPYRGMTLLNRTGTLLIYPTTATPNVG